MIKNLIITFIVSKLFKLITEKDFLIQDKSGKLYVNGIALTDDQKKRIAAEADMIKRTSLWGFMINEMTFVANKKIFFESVTVTDLTFAKCTLWTLDVLSKKIDNMSRLK